MLDIESRVFSRIVRDFPEDLLTEYGMTIDDNFSTEGSSNTDAVFPFVYIHLLPAIEQGMDLENNKIQAGLYTVQIDVTSNDIPTTAKKIMDECVEIMKSMRFNVVSMPGFQFNTSESRQTARFRRMLSDADEI